MYDIHLITCLKSLEILQTPTLCVTKNFLNIASAISVQNRESFSIFDCSMYNITT